MGDTAKRTLAFCLSVLAATAVYGQERGGAGGLMQYRVENGDTVYYGSLQPAYTFARGRDWKKYTKLVHNFSKTYPYAVEAKRTVREVDSTIAAEGMGRWTKDKYINRIQNSILEQYEPVIKNMTVSQGKLLIVLIGRETGMTPYDIINGYKSGAAAGFWQGIAKMFGGDLKQAYDPYGKDLATEELVDKWNSGQFPEFYRSIFGQYPKVPVIKHDGGTAGRKAAKKEKKKKRQKA